MGGVETYFYLTGDQRAKKVIYEQAQFIARHSDPKTGIKNGLDVVDRATAGFHGDASITNEFNAKVTSFMGYLNSEPNGNGYNAVEARLIDLNSNGVHDKAEGATVRGLFESGFEYFVRGAP